MLVGFQGEPGAYSQEAALKFFGPDVKTKGYALSEQVVEALINGDIDQAILPVENSIVGNVNVNIDLLYHNPIKAIGEVYHDIHHHLFVVPGTQLSDIKEVYSHPIALAQCRDYLIQNELRPIADYDTAGSCKLLAQRKSKTQAAIGSKLCAEAYGLEVVSDHIQKVHNNITRFFVLCRNQDFRSHAQNLRERGKTSIAFRAHHHPGALLDCLQIFKSFGINLTKLESRPIVENPFEYIFYADLQLPLNNPQTKECLEELNLDAHHVKILGTYNEGRKSHLQ